MRTLRSCSSLNIKHWELNEKTSLMEFNFGLFASTCGGDNNRENKVRRDVTKYLIKKLSFPTSCLHSPFCVSVCVCMRDIHTARRLRDELKLQHYSKKKKTPNLPHFFDSRHHHHTHFVLIELVCAVNTQKKATEGRKKYFVITREKPQWMLMLMRSIRNFPMSVKSV